MPNPYRQSGTRIDYAKEAKKERAKTGGASPPVQPPPMHKVPAKQGKKIKIMGAVLVAIFLATQARADSLLAFATEGITTAADGTVGVPIAGAAAGYAKCKVYFRADDATNSTLNIRGSDSSAGLTTTGQYQLLLSTSVEDLTSATRIFAGPCPGWFAVDAIDVTSVTGTLKITVERLK